MNLPEHGNLFFDSGKLKEVGGNIGNSILNKCAKKLYAKKYKPKGKAESYMSLELTANGVIKENLYPKFSTLSKNVQSEMKIQLYKHMNLNI